jgi:type II secretory pathway pseudopilin PulG
MRRQRLHEGSKGQGLIEVLGVFGLFGALVAVGVPAFFGYQDGRADREAREQLLAAVPAAETYRTKRGSYSGLDTVDLMRIDPRISHTLVVTSARGGRYCLTESVNGRTWSVAGPVRANARFQAKSVCGRR